MIQFLTGQEAIDAYHDEFPGDPLGPPNDDRLSWSPFWIDVRDGVVTGIVEQYTL